MSLNGKKRWGDEACRLRNAHRLAFGIHKRHAASKKIPTRRLKARGLPKNRGVNRQGTRRRRNSPTPCSTGGAQHSLCAFPMRASAARRGFSAAGESSDTSPTSTSLMPLTDLPNTCSRRRLGNLPHGSQQRRKIPVAGNLCGIPSLIYVCQGTTYS
jgi:hypothetical protein